METVNFLNLEYVVLHLKRISDALYSVFFGNFVGDGSASHIIHSLSTAAGQIALVGMALALILLALAVWVRIKLEVFEHEGFHKREAQYHNPHEEHIVDVPNTLLGGPMHPDAKKERWEHVTLLASSQNEGDWRRAIIEADIMLGELLEAQGYRGRTIGDQLKDANPLQFTTLDLAWQAHKMRNDIAHGGEGFHLSERDVRATIDNYKRVFEEFGFI